MAIKLEALRDLLLPQLISLGNQQKGIDLDKIALVVKDGGLILTVEGIAEPFEIARAEEVEDGSYIRTSTPRMRGALAQAEMLLRSVPHHQV